MNRSEKFKKWLENTWYYYKWWIIVGAMVLITLIISVQDFVGEPPADITIIMATQQSYYKNGSVEAFSEALENYCDDIDKNGKVHVKIREINIKPAETTLQQLNSLQSKFLAEINLADNVIYIFDEPIYNNILKTNNVLDDLNSIDSTVTPETDKILLKDTGVLKHLNLSEKIKEYTSSECEEERKKYDNLYIGVRQFKGTQVENSEKAKKIFEDAYGFLKNILKDR